MACLTLHNQLRTSYERGVLILSRSLYVESSAIFVFIFCVCVEIAVFLLCVLRVAFLLLSLSLCNTKYVVERKVQFGSEESK